MISDKKVIIIGNSPSILEDECGDIIDSYDIVIRVNRCITKGFEKNIGKKIDIWACTHNLFYEDKFIPDDYNNLSEIWHRTPKTKNKLIIPNKPKISDYVMFKTGKFLQEFGDLITDSSTWHLKGTKHELCTGLLAILTSTLFYKDVTIHGFTFYGESNGFVAGYYRDSELTNDKKHKEDIYWTENKDSGFASKNVAIIKQKIIDKMVEDNLIKILK